MIQKKLSKAFERNYVLKQMELNKFINLEQYNYYSNLKIELSLRDTKKYQMITRLILY